MICLLLFAIPLLVAELLHPLGDLLGDGGFVVADGLSKGTRWSLVSRSFGRIAQCLPIRTLAPEDSGLVILPVAFLEFEATVFGPEEEPDACQDESGKQNAKECEDPLVVDVGGVDGAGSRRELGLGTIASGKKVIYGKWGNRVG